jgi:hypothetical protein
MSAPQFDPAGFWAHADLTRRFDFPTGDIRSFTVTAKADYDPFAPPATPAAFAKAQADAIETAAALARWSTLRTWAWGYDAQGEPVPQGFAFMVSVTVQEQEAGR